MNGSLVRALTICLAVGIICCFIGGCQCFWGHTYFVAAQHQANAVGHIVRITSGKGGTPHYHYIFSVNGVSVDDSDTVCGTPLEPGACDNHGPVLVYYSFQPFRISALRDFAGASVHAYRVGETALAIGLAMFFAAFIFISIMTWQNKRDDKPERGKHEDATSNGDESGVIHIVPGE
jgi:hypothetical protein